MKSVLQRYVFNSYDEEVELPSQMQVLSQTVRLQRQTPSAHEE